jgi:hypothetical protein
MKQINDDNIDEIMFQLLEGEITGIERENLLHAIQSDSKYLDLWNAWQNTVLQNEEIPFNVSNLKRKKAFFIPHYLKYAAAAILIFSIIIMLNKDNIKQDDMVLLPPKIKTFKNPLPQIQKDSVYNNHIVRDTFIPLKEKVKYMVEKESSNFETSILEKIETSRNPEIAQSNKVDSILLVKNTPKESNQDKVFEEEIFVSISSDKMLETTKIQSKSNSSFLAKLLGKSSIKIEPDHNTRTKRKIIFENKKYQIIAGF